MSYAIQIDFMKAKAQAQKLESLAERLRSLSNGSYNDTLGQISNDWKSDSATAYLTKGEKLRSELCQTADSLEKAASNIRKTAKRIYLAEKKAEEIAKNRSAKG